MTHFPPRVRFNWGFWDGISDRNQRRNRPGGRTLKDKAYDAGYEAGRWWSGDPETSNEAWEAYKPAKVRI